MEKNTLGIGSIIQTPTDDYVILNVTQDRIVLCQKNTTKLNVVSASPEDIRQYITTGKYNVIPPSPKTVIDTTALSEKSSEKYRRNKKLIDAFEMEYGPLFLDLTHKGKTQLNNFYAEHGTSYSKKQFYQIIRIYLQSGRDISSLYPKFKRTKGTYTYKKKPGKKAVINQGIPITDEVKAHFEYGIAEYKKKRKMSKRDAYKAMIEKYYTGYYKDPFGNPVYGTFPLDHMPTEKQFRNYMDKRLPKYQQEIIETSPQEYRNNHRPLYGDSLDSVYGPGDVWEMDACEIDIKLVTEKNPLISGLRPVLYLMIDVFSKMVVAFSIAYENNSYLGMTNCFLSLLDDKVQMCRDAGVPVPEYFWPANCLPNKIRTDYGAEYISDNAIQLFQSLNITHDFAPPGTGSMKGQVEQFFHQMHTAQNPITENKGLITTRHDSNHNEEAVMTITEYRKFALLFMIQHNAKHLTNYPLSKEMLSAGMVPCPTPYQIWDFGVKMYGQPRPIINENNFRFALLSQVDASVTRMGITFNGLHYADPLNGQLDLAMKNALGRRKKWPIRIDTRDISRIYYVLDGEMITVPLSQRQDSSAFIGWSLPEYREYKKLHLIVEKAADKTNTTNDIVRKQKQEEIVEEAAAKMPKGKKNTKNLKKALREEKDAIRSSEQIFENTMVSIVGNNESIPESITDHSPHKEIEHKPSLASINAKDALIAFAETEMENDYEYEE